MAESKNDGGPAFPTYESNVEGHLYCSGAGMSMRDYFAAKAMHQIIAGAVLPVGYDASKELAQVAERAYEIADAMLRAREAA